MTTRLPRATIVLPSLLKDLLGMSRPIVPAGDRNSAYDGFGKVRIKFRHELCKYVGTVDDETYRKPQVAQPPRQAPRHARVAEVVDHATPDFGRARRTGTDDGKRGRAVRTQFFTRCSSK